MIANGWAGAAKSTALTIVVLAAGCVTGTSKQADDHERLRRVSVALISVGDADSLAAAAMIERGLSGRKSTETLILIARATAAAPQRADLALLQIQLCAQAENCDSEPFEARLRSLDGHNGAPWLYALERSRKAKDAAGATADFAILAQSERIDFYWTTLITHLTTAMTGKEGFDSTSALIYTIGIEAAMVMPLQPVSKACTSEEIQPTDVLAMCRDISNSFRHADTLLLEEYGDRMATRLWPIASPEYDAAQNAMRVLAYRRSLMITAFGQFESWKTMKNMPILYSRYTTEQDVFYAAFVGAGLNPDPPANCKAPGARASAAATAFRTACLHRFSGPAGSAPRARDDA